jgi:hypothetical protein
MCLTINKEVLMQLKEAVQYMTELAEKGLLIHWDDDVKDCLSHKLNKEQMSDMQTKVDDMLEAFDAAGVCPFTYSLGLQTSYE